MNHRWARTLLGLCLAAQSAPGTTEAAAPNQTTPANVSTGYGLTPPAPKGAPNRAVPAALMASRTPSMPQHGPISGGAAPANGASTPRVAQVNLGGLPQAGAYVGAPSTIPAPAATAPPLPVGEGTVPGGGCGCGSGGAGGSGVYPYGPNRRTALHRGWYVPFWHSTGDMPQHNPYFPNAHGYYYFRPYNVIHVVQQQEMVGRWGLDPRNPMDNRFFERIYQEQEQMQAQDTVNAPGPFIPR